MAKARLTLDEALTAFEQDIEEESDSIDSDSDSPFSASTSDSDSIDQNNFPGQNSSDDEDNIRSTEPASSTVAKKKRKRVAKPELWERNKRKFARDMGEEYVNDSGQLIFKAKGPKACDCSKCRFKCSSKILEDQRIKISFTNKAICKAYYGLQVSL